LPLGDLKASTMRDGEGDTGVVEQKSVKRGDTVRIELEAGGGYVARFTP